MRRFLIAVTVALISCNNSSPNDVSARANAARDSTNFTTVQWLDSSQNIGALNMGQIAQIKFRFKNTGDKPLFIVSAEPGCGCTVADYPKEAIGKGQEGVIVAAFDTNKGMVGGFKKGINVRTNTKAGSTFLYFEGEIVSTDGEGKTPEPVETPK